MSVKGKQGLILRGAIVVSVEPPFPFDVMPSSTRDDGRGSSFRLKRFLNEGAP